MSVADESAIRLAAASNVGPRTLDGASSGVEGRAEGEEEPVEEPYFWEEGGDPNVDWWAKVRQSFHFGGVKALAGAESIGEVVANTLGLNDSKYQYVIDALEADELRRQREERDENDRRQLELEEEESRARHRAREDLGDEDCQDDAGAIELGDATVTLPEQQETPLPEKSSAVGGISSLSTVSPG